MKIAVLCDVLIGHCARVTLQASECLHTVGPLCMGGMKGLKGSAKPDDRQEVKGDEVILA